MPERISVHQPLLVNTLGHCAGAAIFGILLYLFVLDYYRSRRSRSKLSGIAAALALLWNLGSLAALLGSIAGNRFAEICLTLSFCVLSLLPAVLLHMSVQRRYPFIWKVGYVVSAIAAALHISDLVLSGSAPQYIALLVVTLGFGSLTLLVISLDGRSGFRLQSGPRLLGAMCLFLLAVSFVHFGTTHTENARAGEFVLHHACIPLALFVLLYDYRFLFLDAFVRFTINVALAAVAAYGCVAGELRFHFLAHGVRNPLYQALLFVAGCGFLAAFAQLKWKAQQILTRVLFRRAPVLPVLDTLRSSFAASETEQDYLKRSFQAIAHYFGSEVVQVKENPSDREFQEITTAMALLEWSRWRPFPPAPGAEVALPVRFSSGDQIFLLLSPRHGGRRYFSEDVSVLSQFGKAMEEQIDRRRQSELQTLVSQAELRALQAQINPHFFFNSLNTLYGTITRDNVEARRLVLNLADVFRYFLRSEKTFITVEEELRIVRAYLEIEELRLGPKLTTHIAVEDSILHTEIPVLSIQPLVENAVKHGAGTIGQGFVSLEVKQRREGVAVEVSNSGEFRPSDTPGPHSGSGVGMANVRRRLRICYGHEGDLKVSSENGNTLVSFLIPSRVAPVS